MFDFIYYLLLFFLKLYFSYLVLYLLSFLFLPSYLSIVSLSSELMFIPYYHLSTVRCSAHIISEVSFGQRGSDG